MSVTSVKTAGIHWILRGLKLLFFIFHNLSLPYKQNIKINNRQIPFENISIFHL